MADVVVGPLVQNLVSLLEEELTLIGGVNKDVKKLTGTLSTIQAVLKEAEDKQVKEQSIADWLNKLKDAAYDLEDALDLWLTTTQQREPELTDASSSKQVSCSIPICLNFKEIIFHHKIAKRLKEIISKIDDIAEQRSKFHLNNGTVPQTEYSGLDQKRETSSITSEPKIYGRDDDQKNIIDKLLSNESQDLCVFPLVGFGGVGKTTLAQLVYNDERVVGHFEARVWVCVSEPFDVKRILKEIIESFQSCTRQSLQSIQTKVEELLKDKKYLLVLDDVWNENEYEWNKLRSFIKSGAKGSSVVVTTRSPKVASVTATIKPYRVGVLSDDDCWSLLKHCALGDKGQEQYPENLVSIGKDIMKRCKGVPLAAKSLGSLLYSKTEENHWINVRDSEIWKLKTEENHWKNVRDNEIWNSKGGDDDILRALRLSYNHLPSNLKQCFSYCSIFPKDHKINKTNLICLWIANGFIQPKEKMEEIGDAIFNELLRWSFFQDTEEDKYGNIETCKMHDLMHDLACSIAENDCRIVKIDGRPNVPKRIRHLTMILESKQSSTAFNRPFLRSLPSLRTLVFLDSPNIDGLVFQRTLRVLDIRRTGMKALPPSVLHLRQLRYLNLSHNNLKSLPESICRLVNLQMLDVSDQNRVLETLPSSIGELEHLRYLNLTNNNLKSLPDSICRLVNLQMLDVSDQNRALETLPSSIGELEHLRYLNLTNNNLKSLPDSICRLVNLQMLDVSDQNRVLETLPSSIGELEHLRYLNLAKNKLKSLPDSICRLRNLRWLDLSYNQEITILPQSIGNLTNLRHLNLSNCICLKSLPETVCDLMNLQSLLLYYCQKLKELPKKMKNMRSLIHLDILYCSELRKLPSGIGELTSLRTLDYFLVAVGYDDSDSDRRDGCGSGIGELTSLRTLAHFSVAVAVGDDDSDSDRRDGCGSGTAGIKELHGLNQLRGSLHIDGLENVRNSEEARMANLRSKQYLTKLYLRWRYDQGGSLQAINKSQEVLQGLLPLPPNLELMTIGGYGTEEFPPQIFQGGGGVLNTTLQSLQIRCCPKLKSLPAEIGDLKALKSLEIKDCKELVSFPKELQKLTSLAELLISDCPELELELGTPDFDHLVSFPVLESLQIRFCKNLRTLPDWLKNLTTLQSLDIYNCHPDLKERCKRKEGEDWHKIFHIPNIRIDEECI